MMTDPDQYPPRGPKRDAIITAVIGFTAAGGVHAEYISHAFRWQPGPDSGTLLDQSYRNYLGIFVAMDSPNLSLFSVLETHIVISVSSALCFAVTGHQMTRNSLEHVKVIEMSVFY